MNNSKKHLILAVALTALLAVVSGCKKKAAPPPVPPPPKPVTATLSASPTSIERGQSSTLTWSTENADDVTLDGQKVNASGSQSVSPTETTTYHLTAKGAGGTQDTTAQVTVAQPTPTPTPTPAPTPTATDEEVFAQAAQDIYFDFDKADLRPQSQQILAHLAEVIKAHPNWKVQIEGNCDERGSTEYNLALGERRAESARAAMAQGGVSADQLKTISYGKEKPVCTESNEDCWQRNRHDHFTLTSH
ncbi:MAG TPA: peptidoglycan-associated lipoprotein Pal [Candidatus Limnocylindrales bacterium]|nr:peptidoglycan-associated lipoprotein Pal [Candidatus Limnocylindrales bacterium]